jgi:hypothetical protein
MEILFKNGKTLKISQSVANTLRDGILSGEAKTFRCFKTDSHIDVTLIINLQEITSVHEVY